MHVFCTFASPFMKYDNDLIKSYLFIETRRAATIMEAIFLLSLLINFFDTYRYIFIFICISISAFLKSNKFYEIIKTITFHFYQSFLLGWSQNAKMQWYFWYFCMNWIDRTRIEVYYTHTVFYAHLNIFEKKFSFWRMQQDEFHGNM